MNLERLVEDLQYITSELEDGNPYQYCEGTFFTRLVGRLFAVVVRLFAAANEWHMKRYPRDTRTLSDAAWHLAWFINSTYCPEHPFFATPSPPSPQAEHNEPEYVDTSVYEVYEQDEKNQQ